MSIKRTIARGVGQTELLIPSLKLSAISTYALVQSALMLTTVYDAGMHEWVRHLQLLTHHSHRIVNCKSCRACFRTDV